MAGAAAALKIIRTVCLDCCALCVTTAALTSSGCCCCFVVSFLLLLGCYLFCMQALDTTDRLVTCYPCYC